MAFGLVVAVVARWGLGGLGIGGGLGGGGELGLGLGHGFELLEGGFEGLEIGVLFLFLLDLLKDDAHGGGRGRFVGGLGKTGHARGQVLQLGHGPDRLVQLGQGSFLGRDGIGAAGAIELVGGLLHLGDRGLHVRLGFGGRVVVGEGGFVQVGEFKGVALALGEFLELLRLGRGGEGVGVGDDLLLDGEQVDLLALALRLGLWAGVGFLVGDLDEVRGRTADARAVEVVIVAGLGVVGDEFVIVELEWGEGELGGGGKLAVLEGPEGNRHGALGRAELVEDELDGSDAEVVGGFHHEGDRVGGGGSDVLAGLGEVDLRRFVAEGADGVDRTVEAGASAGVGEDDGVGVVVGDRKVGGPELVGEVAQGQGGAVGELERGAAEGDVGIDAEHGAGAAEGGDGRALLFGGWESGVGRRSQPDGEVADLGRREGGEGELRGNGIPGGDPPTQGLRDAEAVGGGAVGQDGKRSRLPDVGACGQELEFGLGRNAAGKAVGQGELGADGELAIAEAGLDAGEAGLGPGSGGAQQGGGPTGCEERKSEHRRQHSGKG